MNQESPRLNSERLRGCFLVKQVNSGELHQTGARQERDIRELKAWFPYDRPDRPNRPSRFQKFRDDWDD